MVTRHRGHRYTPMLQIVANVALSDCQNCVLGGEITNVLFLVIRRVEEEQEEPMSPDVVPTFDTTTVFMSVCK